MSVKSRVNKSEREKKISSGFRLMPILFESLRKQKRKNKNKKKNYKTQNNWNNNNNHQGAQHDNNPVGLRLWFSSFFRALYIHLSIIYNVQRMASTNKTENGKKEQKKHNKKKKRK